MWTSFLDASSSSKVDAQLKYFQKRVSASVETSCYLDCHIRSPNRCWSIWNQKSKPSGRRSIIPPQKEQSTEIGVCEGSNCLKSLQPGVFGIPGASRWGALKNVGPLKRKATLRNTCKTDPESGRTDLKSLLSYFLVLWLWASSSQWPLFPHLKNGNVSGFTKELL